MSETNPSSSPPDRQWWKIIGLALSIVVVVYLVYFLIRCLPAWKASALTGLVLSVIGVILLFFFVMPRRQRTGGTQRSVPTRPHFNEALKEWRWDWYSAIGLLCVISGTIAQAVSVLIAP